LLGGEFMPGDTIEVESDGDRFTFKRAAGGPVSGEVVEAELIED
jgi:hypothetical protein